MIIQTMTRAAAPAALPPQLGFDFDDGRITAGVHLYPMLTDPENMFTVYEVFTFDGKKTAFREAIGKLKK